MFKPYASVATAILIFGKSGTTESVWFYRLENDGFNNDAVKSPRPGSELPEILRFWQRRHSKSYLPQKAKHRFVSRDEIKENGYDLCERVYLSGYEYPKGIPLKHLDELFTITRGNTPAAQAEGGPYQFVTSSEEPKFHNSYSFDSEAICIPLVSATGHGHASIKTIHHVNGKFEAATITAVLLPKPGVRVHIPYVFYYLLAHKDQLLVPLMRGAANVSLNLDRLARLRVPVPSKIGDQKALVASLESAEKEIMKCRLRLKNARELVFDQVERFRARF